MISGHKKPCESAMIFPRENALLQQHFSRSNGAAVSGLIFDSELGAAVRRESIRTLTP
jgi:hypothetical protein